MSPVSPPHGSGLASFGSVYEAGTGRPDQTKQGSTVLTDHAWAADGTLTSRIDGTFGTTTFAYDWAKRPTTLTPPPGTGFSGGLTHAYRLDGLLARTSYGNGEVATLAYDDARRPIGIDYTGGRWLDRGYDRAGRVVSDDRSLGIAGAAGTGQLTHAYDALGRLLSTRLDGTVIGAYSYDRSSNRLTKTEDTDDDDILESFASSYDRTDALISQTIDTGSPQTFTYDPAGNVTTERTRSGSSRTLAWDARNRLTAITPSSGNAATMTYDPLDRVATRTVTGSTTRTFAYVGASDLAWQVPSGTADARLLTGSDGSQPGVSRSGTAKWLLPDLLGSVALAQPATTSITTSDALRTDAWGTAIGTYPSTGSDLAVRFRGLVDLSPTADPDVSTGTGLGGDALYEMGARTYSPHTGSFSSLDTYPGSAVNPISMSRYLYAHADPATLIDPTGHYSCEQDPCEKTPTPAAQEHDRKARAETEAARHKSHTPTSTTTSNGTTQWAGGSVAPPVRDDWAGAWSASAGPTAGQAREAMYGACHPRNPRNHPPDCTSAAGSGQPVDPWAVLGVALMVVGGVLVCVAVCVAIVGGVAAGGAALAAGQGLLTAGTIACIRACAATGVAAEYVAGTVCGCLVGGETPSTIGWSAIRAVELQGQVPAASRGYVTMAAGVARSSDGSQIRLIGTSEANGYLRPGVLLADGEVAVAGRGHAEEDIVSFARAQEFALLEVGAGRPICPSCASLIDAAGAASTTPRR